MSISPQLTWFYERRRLQTNDIQTELEQSDRSVYLWRGINAHKLLFEQENDAARLASVADNASTDGLQMHDVSSQQEQRNILPAESLSDAACTNGDSFNRLKARIGMHKRHEPTSKVPIPMLRADSIRLWLYVVVNVLSSFLCLHVDIRVCVLGLIATAVVIIAAMSLQVGSESQSV